jgi:glycerol-3-phosphate acyltransferase PlsX
LNSSLTVSVDAMGGDAGPSVVVAALARAVVRHPNVRFLLHGDEAELKPLLAKRGKLSEKLEIRHSAERVRMEDKPSQVLRRGRNTSMWRAIESVAKKEAQVAISAGNTGALMAMSMFQLRTLDGLDRPAIAAIWPTKRGQSVVLDVGANIETDAQQLVDFAVMGEAFARAIFGLERPSLGLLNVGEEDQKGHESLKTAAQILRNSRLPIVFHGFVEGDDIAEGTTDVVVTDGFSGNVALKTAEGTAKLVVTFLRTAMRRSLLGRIGGFFAAGALSALRRKLDPRASNGGIFLGLNGVVVKSHGGTDALGFSSALDMAIDMTRADVNSKILADRDLVAPGPSVPAAPAASGVAVS